MNMTYQNALILLLFLLCPQLQAQKLIEDEDGIWQEYFDSTKTIPHTDAVSLDNKIYTIGRRFVYDFVYISHQDTFKINFLKVNPPLMDSLSFISFIKETNRAWKKVVLDSITKNTISTVQMTVQKESCNEGQSCILYEYIQDNSLPFSTKETTGLIENRNNIWLHPPRERFFKITELNPFPYIKKPYKIGNKWTWALEIGSYWGSPEWKEWEGKIDNEYNYEITGKKKIQTFIGALECLEVTASAKSRIGETHAIFYFNKKYGFVKWIYTNINGSQLLFDIKKID